MKDITSKKPRRLLDIFADGARDFYRAQNCSMGQIDLFLLDRHRPTDQIRGVIEGLLGFVDPESRKTIFSQLWVVVPGTSFVGEELKEFTDILAGLVERARKAFPAHQLPGDWLQIRTTPDYQQATLEGTLAQAAADAAIIVSSLADYRCPGIAPNDPGANRLKLEEDIWVPHVAALAKSLEALAKARHLYIAGMVGRMPPRRPELNEALHTIEGAIQSADQEINLEAEILAREADISGHLAAGRIGAAMAMIDDLPNALDSQKPFLKVQFLDRAKLPQMALDMIERELAPQADETDPVSLIRLAIIAEQAGGTALAARLIRTSLPELTQRETLEAALQLADGIPQYNLVQMARDRLQELFPDSPVLLQHAAEQARDAGDFNLASKINAKLPGRGEAASFYRSFHALTAEPAFDHDQVLSRLVAEQPQWKWQAHRLMVREALRRGRLYHAFRWALDADASLFRPHLLMETLERLALERDHAGNSILGDDDLTQAIRRILRHLATAPDGGLRVRLIALLSPETLGLHGLSLMVVLAIKTVLRAKRIIPERPPKGLSEAEYNTLDDFLRQAMKWLQSQDNLVMGRAILPAKMLTMPADRICRGIGILITEHKFDISDPDDVKTIATFVTIGAAVAAHAPRSIWDIELIRLAGARIGGGGQGQMARDFAETAFEIAGDKSYRQRAAWLAMADIYQRLGNRLEGFVALTAGAFSEDERDIEGAWEELQILMRLCRDQHLYGEALRVLDAMEKLGEDFGVADANRNRLVFMRLQIEQILYSEDDADPDEVAEFVTRFADHAQSALEEEGDLMPVAVGFGQAIRRAHDLKVPVPSKIQSLFARILAELPNEAAAFVRIMASNVPTKNDLFAIAARVQQARYADDAGTDARYAAMVSRRALSSPNSLGDAAGTALAIELLADRATPVPGWEAIARPPAAIASADDAFQKAQALSGYGAAIVLLAIDDHDRLVRLLIVDGTAKAKVIEDPTVFSGDALMAWRQEFPFRYGIDRDTPNLFYTTTENLGFTLRPDWPVILVADVSLQVIPPNLWRVGDAFLGQVTPCASVPSLSWLVEARAKMAISTRRQAWISASEEKGHTLTMVADRLQETFDRHGIVLDRSEALPKGFDGAELAIVTAHGGLLPDGSFFQVVRDEGHVVVDAGDFANAFHNVGVMVLFVCSGGRQDRHPDAVATVGLVKRLLKAGCSTVIASPWPMDARIPSHWLPVFMGKWAAGANAMEANFAANRAVGHGLGGELAEAIAMNVFGDPLRTRIAEG